VGNALHFANPIGNAYFWFCHKKKKIGTQHGSRITRLGTFGGIVIMKQRGDVRQIGTPELRDQRPVLVGDDEDPAGIMLA
ncbi:MAG TPA: hypothetical protein DD730_01175, partial [Desulfosporosinus sp.]|nr:hypothetical protein [Desulfosporosinus sp.]